MQRSQNDLGDPSSQAVSSDDRQLDAKYRQLVTQRQIVINQRQRVQSLQDLTLKIVLDIVEQCALNNQESRLLDVLPGALLDLVYDKLTMYDMCNFDIVKQMITQRSRRVEFYLGETARYYEPEWSQWTQDNITSLLALLDKCKNKLTTLKVILSRNLGKKAVRPSLPQLHELLGHQTNLRELRLTCGINDQTLALISSTCHNLRVLDVSDNEEVTDVGLEYLSEGPEGKLSNITNLNISDTNCTSLGIVKLMVKLQAQLEYVEADDYEMGQTLVRLCQLDSPIRLSKYKRTCLEFDESNVTQYFPNIVNLMPNVSSVDLLDCQDVSPLINLTKVTELDLWLDNCHVQKLILEKLILQLSTTLTNVNLFNNSNTVREIDFSVFTQCPNLEVLSLRNLCPQTETNHELLPSSFSKLCEFHFSSGTENTLLPDLIVTKMLTSTCLKRFHVGFIIKDHVIRSVISEAQINTNILSNLKYLDIRVSSDFTLDMWIQLLCVVPDNAEIRKTGRTSDEWSEKLQSFARRNKIKVYISV